MLPHEWIKRWLKEHPQTNQTELAELAGMRPGEACGMNLRDLDRSDSPWAYRVSPDFNKTEHHDRPRMIFLGPKAQAILGPHIAHAEATEAGWVFTPSQGRNRGKRPYPVNYLQLAINGFLKRRGLPHFSPHQLRHTALSEIHRTRGIDAARAVGGHSDAKTTLVYIDPDVATIDEREAARSAAMEMG